MGEATGVGTQPGHRQQPGRGGDVEQSHNYAFWSADGFSEDQYSQVTMVNIGLWNGVIVRAKADVDITWPLLLVTDKSDSTFVRTASRLYPARGGLGRLGIVLALKLPAQVQIREGY